MWTYFGIVVAIALAVGLPSGCDTPDSAARLAHTVGPAQPAGVDPAAQAAAANVAERQTASVEIYPDLSIFPWYQRAEPLVFQEHDYLPQGRPRAIVADEMREAGRYRGVRFYVRKGDKPPYTTVYVPVYEGYWQPFVSDVDEASRA